MHLVINEVDYDNISTDTAEYIEIYNPTAAAVSLINIKVVLVNGTGSVPYNTIDLSTATSLPAGGYLVIAGANVTVPASAIKVAPAGFDQDELQNGAPDGLVLIDDGAKTVIDALSYEGSITAVTLAGFAAPISLVEGTAVPAATADSSTVQGSFCRQPDGQDTDNASLDWAFCSALSVGVANP
jgi:vibriolysin